MGIMDIFSSNMPEEERAYKFAQLSDAFGSLRDNGGGPRRSPAALKALQSYQRNEKARAALLQAQGGEGLPMGFNSPQFQAYAEGNPEQALQLMAQQAIKGPAERKVLKGADGYQYYADGSRVLPGVQAPETGWRDATPQELARYGAAAGQINSANGKFAPINPATGMRIESDGAGGFTFAQGAGVTNGVTRKTRNDLEGKEFEARDSLARLDTIESNLANPDFMESLTAAGRLKQWGLEWADTLDPSLLGPEQQEYLANVATARGDVLENVNFTIKAITGAAMTEPEAKRIGATLPGVNDSPTVFKAKLKRSLSRTRAAVARYHLWKSGGGQGDPSQYDTLGNVEGKMMDRAAELKKAVEAGEMNAAAASAQFRLEFGT